MSKIISGIKIHQISKGGAGVPTQELGKKRALKDDFIIESSSNMIHFINAPSPAATALLSIGETIYQLAKDKFQI